MAHTSINEFDIIFISYDEDNAEENWADLQNKAPWAKRVHGVKGSDAAHKAAADLSETDLLITVDADNIVDPAFFDLELDLDNPKLSGKAISWTAKNYINGLEYGNGGLKLWPKQFVLKMQTHEASQSNDPRSQIEFCYENDYIQMVNQYSVTHPNGSPRQAFRAGFREGVKMSLDQGKKVIPAEFKKRIWWGNYKRLITWCSVGADVENGLWAVYGARLGCYLTTCTDWDYIQVRDFEYINKLFEEEKLKYIPLENAEQDRIQKCYKTNHTWDIYMLESGIMYLGDALRQHVGLEVCELNDIQSKFFKTSYTSPPRMNKMFTEEELNELRRINK